MTHDAGPPPSIVTFTLVSGGVVGGGRGDGEGWSGSGAGGGVAGAASEGGGVRDYHLCRTHRHIIDLSRLSNRFTPETRAKMKVL